MIYDDEYYEKRLNKLFLLNENIFQKKKIIWLFYSLDYNFKNSKKQKKIINFKMFNDYKITYTENNTILNKNNLHNYAKSQFNINHFITFPICLFKNITIEGILLINDKYTFFKKSDIYLNKLYLTNNHNENIINNILNYHFNDFNDNIKINIEDFYLNINIKLLLESIIPYY